MNKNIAIAGGALVLVLGGAAAVAKATGFLDASRTKKPAVAAPRAPAAIVATVNGQPVTENEVLPLVQNGVERASAMDRRITQSVLAIAAETQYAQESREVLESTRKDILAQMYLNKRTQAIAQAVTDKDIADFYARNVVDTDYRQARLKVAMFGDAKEAQTFYEKVAAARGTKDIDAATAKMEYIKRDGDRFVTLPEVPYQLGQLVKKLKGGDVMQPLVTREGILVMYVEEIKDMPKPGIDKMKEEIRSYLVNERMGREVQDLRKKVVIELKG